MQRVEGSMSLTVAFPEESHCISRYTVLVFAMRFAADVGAIWSAAPSWVSEVLGQSDELRQGCGSGFTLLWTDHRAQRWRHPFLDQSQLLCGWRPEPPSWSYRRSYWVEARRQPRSPYWNILALALSRSQDSKSCLLGVKQINKGLWRSFGEHYSQGGQGH